MFSDVQTTLNLLTLGLAHAKTTLQEISHTAELYVILSYLKYLGRRFSVLFNFISSERFGK